MARDPKLEVQAYADACIRCGLCAQTDCGNYSPGTPNLGDICASILSGDETWRHFPFTCALCNRCTVNCPVGLKAIDACKPMRGYLLPKHPEIRPLYRKFRTDLKYNLFSTLSARERGDIEDIRYCFGSADLGGQADTTAFFPGCALFAYAPKLTSRVFDWLREERLAARMLTVCCGATFYDPGFFEEFEAYKVRAQKFFNDKGIRRLVITCPHCAYELPELLEGTGIEIVELSRLLGERGKVSDYTGRISFHDACYDRSDQRFRTLVQALYPKAQIVEMHGNKKNSICCGGGGMVSVYARDYCTYRREQRLAQIDAVQADIILSTCFSCVNSLQRGDNTKPVQHFLEPLFDEIVNWREVYASVDALYFDPAYEELCAREDKTYE